MMNERLPDNVFPLFPGRETQPPLTPTEASTQPVVPTEADPGGIIPADLLGVTTPTPVETHPAYFSAKDAQDAARRQHPSQGNIPPS